MKKTIQKELKIWKTAYPKQKELLDKFANKIYFELSIKFLSKEKINKKFEDWKRKFIKGLKEEYCKCKLLGTKKHKVRCGFCYFIDKLAEENTREEQN